MTVIGHVYRYTPNAQTATAHLNGINAAAQKSADLGRSWKVVSDGGTPRALTIGHVTLPYLVRFTASGTNNILCSFSHDGTLFSAARLLASDSAFNSTVWGTAIDKAWVVETEHTFSVYTKTSGSNQSATAAYVDAMGFSYHAGKIATPDNRSDDELTGVYGALCGVCVPFPLATGANVRALAATTDPAGPPSQMLINGAWEQIRVQRSFVRGIHITGTQFTGDEKYTAPLGDTDGVERLSPIRVMGKDTGTFANLRFWRARNWAVAQTDGTGLIYSNDQAGALGGVRQSSADPNIRWRHTTNNGSAASGFDWATHNTIFFWGNPADMTLV
jgi:hypothetical protein